MHTVLDITKALADGSRLRTLMALMGGELCVCQIIELLGLAPSTVSKHMAILRQARLVEARKEGRWIYYHLASRSGSKTVRNTLVWVRPNLAETSQIEKDAVKLKRILRIDREDLCRKQTRN